MGRNTARIDDQHFVVFGFDGPCGGYFAEYYDTNSEEYKNGGAFSDEVGFLPGVSKNRVLEFFEKHDCVEAVKTQRSTAYEKLCLDLPC